MTEIAGKTGRPSPELPEGEAPAEGQCPPGRVAVVIPAWNEAESLAPLLDELHTLPAGLVEWVVVADGGSTDGTPEVARARGAVVASQRQRGYGGACWEGFHTARGLGATHIVFLDGDGSDPPAAIPELLAAFGHEGVRPRPEREAASPDTASPGPVETRLRFGEASPGPGNAALILGVRRSPLGQGQTIPWHARAGNALVCALLRWRTGRSVSDLPSMKVISVAGLERLDMREMGYGWTTEMIARALMLGYRVTEMPVLTRPRTGGESKVSGNLRASVRAAIALLRTAITASRREA